MMKCLHFLTPQILFQIRFVVMADIGTAFLGLATLLEKYLLGILTVALVIEGYMYMTSLDDPQKLMGVKRAISATIVGAIIVVVAATLAPELVSAFGK